MARYFRRHGSDWIPTQPPTDHIRAQQMIEGVAQSPEEAVFLRARLSGEHRTSSLATLIGAGALSAREQQMMVKRMTERLRLRLRRLRRRTEGDGKNLLQD